MDLLDVGLIFKKGKQTNGLLSATDCQPLNDQMKTKGSPQGQRCFGDC